jgi:sulfonate transport system permease protein
VTRRLSSVAWELWLPVLVVAVWWFASARWNSAYFPPLADIVDTFFETWTSDRLSEDLLPSLARFGAGLGIALAVGVALGVVLGLSSTLRRLLDPVIDFFRAMPKPALLPLAILLLGVGESMKIAFIAFGALWPILLNSIDGVRSVDPDMVAMSRVYGLSRWQRIRHVILPAASPQMFVGARLALASALILMVVSEMLASTNGLGYFVLQAQQTFAILPMWAGILMLGLVGYLVNVIFLVVERRALAWHRGWRAAALGGAPAGGPN